MDSTVLWIPPNVVFWGGNGSGASGNAVLNTFGDIIGVDMVSGGSYTSPPLISFEDNCGNGKGAVGIPFLEIQSQSKPILVTMMMMNKTKNGEV